MMMGPPPKLLPHPNPNPVSLAPALFSVVSLRLNLTCVNSLITYLSYFLLGVELVTGRD